MSLTSGNRRQFLSRAFGLGAAAAVPSWFSRLASAADGAGLGPAIGKPPRFFIFAYFSGGWDVLLSLDPRDPNVFTDAASGVTQIQPGYDRLVDTKNDGSLVIAKNGAVFGPYIGGLVKHVDHLAVVRGMSMDTLTHDVGRRRFITGKPPSGLQARGSSAATWLAAMLGQNNAVPNLAIKVETYNVDQPNFATGLKVDRVPDLVRAFRPSDPALDPTIDAVIDELMMERAACPGAANSPVLQAAEGGRKKARDMVSHGYDALFDFQAKTNAMGALRDRYGIGATGTAALETPEAMAAAAATAITSGLSRTASFMATSGLDTHFDNWTRDHGPNQLRGFNAVSALVDDLASREYLSSGASWLDHTVIVGFSEFTRSPTLNAAGGRDHHLQNSCFLLGGPVKGGLYGASTDVGMLPQPMDLTSGVVSQGGEIVRPEHVLQALFHEVGAEGDPADLRVPALTAVLKGG